MGYAIRITTRAVEVVSGADQAKGIVAAESSGVKVGLRQKWGGGELRARTKSGRMIQQGNRWVMEGGAESPYGTPVSNGFPSPAPQSPFFNSGLPQSPLPPTTPNPGSSVGLGFPSGTFGPTGFPGSPPINRSTSSGLNPTWTPGPPKTPFSAVVPQPSSPGVPSSVPATPSSYATFPPTPGPNGNGFQVGPPPKRANGPKKDD